MSKYIHFSLIVVYILLVVSIVFFIIEVFGSIHTHHPFLQFISVIAGYLLICFSATYILPDWWLLFQEVRYPLMEEEVRLRRCLSMVSGIVEGGTSYRFGENIDLGASDQFRQIATAKAQCQLRIEEENNPNAFAVGSRTIIVSAGLLQELPDDELAAVLAHELGHLITKNCIAAASFICATYIPRKLVATLKIGLLLLSCLFRKGIAQGFIVLVIISFLIYHFHILTYVIAATLMIGLLSGLQAIFKVLWLLNCRQTEYRQDAFVHRLGLGQELRRVLLKINNSSPQKVNFFYTLQSTHPIIFNRIRRLEQLETSEQPLEMTPRARRNRA